MGSEGSSIGTQIFRNHSGSFKNISQSADHLIVQVEPDTPVLVEVLRRDGIPALRRARLVARSGPMLGVVHDQGALTDLAVHPGATVGVSAPGRFGTITTTVVDLDHEGGGLVVRVAPTVVPLRERRRHARSLVTIDATWVGGAASTTDVSPGGVLLAGRAPRTSVSLSLELPDRTIRVFAEPVPRARDARLRFATVVAELEADRVVAATTFARRPRRRALSPEGSPDRRGG